MWSSVSLLSNFPVVFVSSEVLPVLSVVLLVLLSPFSVSVLSVLVFFSSVFCSSSLLVELVVSLVVSLV